jgi:hypothetical protein
MMHHINGGRHDSDERTHVLFIKVLIRDCGLSEGMLLAQCLRFSMSVRRGLHSLAKDGQDHWKRPAAFFWVCKYEASQNGRYGYRVQKKSGNL